MGGLREGAALVYDGVAVPGAMMRLSLLSLLSCSVLMALGPAEAWKAGLLKARREKDAQFRSGKTSPLAGLQRLTVEAGREAGVRLAADGLELTEGTASILVRQREAQWLWCTASGETPMAGGVVFSVGRFHVQGQVSAEQATLLVFDPERPEVKSFRGLRYFPPNRAGVVSATLEPFKEAEPITLATTRNLKKRFTPYARLRFRLGGKQQSLTAYRSAGDSFLFIPFTDATTGRETYRVGRFLEVPVPTGKTLSLDFNAAFNPLCAYSGIWNCPLPPDENALEVPVRAGERAYGDH